jgi:hypothetical protein
MTAHIKEIDHDTFRKAVYECLPELIEKRDEEDRKISDGDEISLRPGTIYNETEYTLSTVIFNDDHVHEELGTTPAHLLMLSEERCHQLINVFFDEGSEQKSVYCIRAQEN